MRLAVLCLSCLPLLANAEEALVAVAANFSPVLEQLKDEFEASTDHVIGISSASTGILYAQVLNGAPYDVMLAADQERPRLLENTGFGIAGSRFTYATGRLALWSADESLVGNDLRETLLQPRLRKLAIANPSLAPYGRAAREALQALRIDAEIGSKIVMGENAGQTFALVALQSADAGIVALSQVLLHRQQRPGRYLEIPAELHAPVRQDAVLLAHGRDNSAARDLLRFLQSDAIRARIATFGYGTE